MKITHKKKSIIVNIENRNDAFSMGRFVLMFPDMGLIKFLTNEGDIIGIELSDELLIKFFTSFISLNLERK